jgi:hypothetical protein
VTPVLELLAIVCFIVATVWFAITRSWPMFALSLGVLLFAIAGTSIIHV